MSKPEKRVEFDLTQTLISEYRRIKENSDQILALIGNLERSFAVVEAESNLELIFDQDEIVKMTDVKGKMSEWKKIAERAEENE
jgi:hypothetical protein